MNNAKTLGDVSNSIEDVLGLDYQYKVPLYQRRYVWEEANWEKLWGDILYQENLKRNPKERSAGLQGHFTGPIVTLPIEGEQNKFEVIDGQQRLTTFQIVFCVIRDLWITDIPLKSAAERYIMYGDTHKFVPTTYDKKTFEKVVEGDYGKVIASAFDESQNCLIPEKIEEARLSIFGTKRVSPDILKVYNYFYENIRKYLGTDRTKAVTLIATIEDDFKLIHLTLGTPEQAERIFESINATGRMLSDFDYLRNYLFLRARELGKDTQGKLYRDIYYKSYWKFENTSNYWDASKLKVFFRTFLMAVWNPNNFKEENTKPFEEYRAYSKSLDSKFSTNKDKIEHEFEQLNSYAESYEGLRNANPTSEVGEHRQFYTDLGLRSLDPFLLFVKRNYPRELIGSEGVCSILESYIVRRMFVYGGDPNIQDEKIEESYTCINDFFLSAIIKHGEFNTRNFAESLQQSWPDDQQVVDAFLNTESKSREIVEYIFRKMMEHEAIWNFENQENFDAEIRKTLENKTPEENCADFNLLWPYPRYFT